jgi:hypothetical protein
MGLPMCIYNSGGSLPYTTVSLHKLAIPSNEPCLVLPFDFFFRQAGCSSLCCGRTWELGYEEDCVRDTWKEGEGVEGGGEGEEVPASKINPLQLALKAVRHSTVVKMYRYITIFTCVN